MTELRELALLGEDGRPRPSLFWSAAREWSVTWFGLSGQPGPDVMEAVQRLLRLRLEELDDAGWAEAGDAAAAALGAPIVAEGPPRLLLPDQRALTWALRTFGEASEEREVDLIVERDDGRVLPMEVKLAATVDDADIRHLHLAQGRTR